MSEKNNHPTMEEIMDFASLSKDTLDKSRFGDYFAKAVHFAQCEKCRKIKDQMVKFSHGLDSLLFQNQKDRELKLKGYYSLETLNILDKWNHNEILVSVKDKIAGQMGKSVIQSIQFDREKEKKMQFDDNLQDEYSELTDEYNNLISLGKEKIEVDLCDDGKDKH